MSVGSPIFLTRLQPNSFAWPVSEPDTIALPHGAHCEKCTRPDALFPHYAVKTPLAKGLSI